MGKEKRTALPRPVPRLCGDAAALARCCCVWCSQRRQLGDNTAEPPGDSPTIPWLVKRNILRASTARQPHKGAEMCVCVCVCTMGKPTGPPRHQEPSGGKGWYLRNLRGVVHRRRSAGDGNSPRLNSSTTELFNSFPLFAINHNSEHTPFPALEEQGY